MVSPLDIAWDVAKGEAFHPSVAGYMAAGHGGERAARPNAEADNRSMANMPLRPTLFEGRGKPVGPTGELDTSEFDFTGRPDQSRKYKQRGLNYPYYFDTKGMADRHDAEQELPMLQRSFDSPIDTAWSILKELSREDLEMAARTGGVSRLDAHPEMVGHTMRPGFRINEEIDLSQAAPMTSVIQPPAYDERSEMMQEYNELINPEEEAEHHRINALTPVKTGRALVRPQTFASDYAKRRGTPIPIEEAGEASMPDPSQMEHLGAQLAHADMMRDDLVDMSNVEGGGINRPAYDYIRERYEAARPFKVEDIMNRIMNGEQVSDEEILYLQNNM